jgi:hypothetical protein
MSLRTELQALHQQFGREAAWSAVAEVCHIAIGDKATPGFGNANLITRESRILTTAINLPRLPF